MNEILNWIYTTSLNTLTYRESVLKGDIVFAENAHLHGNVWVSNLPSTNIKC